MGAPKGSYNARAFHEERRKKTLHKLKAELRKIRKSKARFDTITVLSQAVGERIGVSDVTLRSPKNVYREHLSNHLLEQEGGKHLLSTPERRILVLESEIRTLRLENSNQKVKLKLLTEALSKSDTVNEVPKETGHAGAETTGCWLDEFECTATLVSILMRHVGGLEVDTENGVVVDTASASGNDPIAGPNVCLPYVKWCMGNRK
ncbi:hypothetical protein [Tropicibacter sp. Alg240-R139]|uniref:hypothetical protein n=1 Tax=Tropicibacter sp. Alg240-R139 TaxID=2305991 RepID=UPI0013DF50B4|nr:hypothetical protein [Tropicibacter sp. Alg240-R139]